MKSKSIKFHPGILLFLLFLFTSQVFLSCSLGEDKSITPQKNADTPPVDNMLIAKGQFIFTKKCMECHTTDVKLSGIDLQDITKRRKADWIMNMILKTDEMIKNDTELSKRMLEHSKKMIVKDISKEDAKAVLEYLKSFENK